MTTISDTELLEQKAAAWDDAAEIAQQLYDDIDDFPNHPSTNINTSLLFDLLENLHVDMSP